MRLFIYILTTLTLTACSRNEKTVVLTEQTAMLPEASAVPLETDNLPGSSTFIANCQTCHTARYIDMQPRFPRKTWEKEVDKMIHSYGAQIDDSTAKVIVDYLVMRQNY